MPSFPRLELRLGGYFFVYRMGNEMTTREQIIAAAKEAGMWWGWGIGRMDDFLIALYALAFEAGRVAEREETNRRPLPDNTAPYIRARGDTK